MEKNGAVDKARVCTAGAVINEVSKQGLELVFGSEAELHGCAKVIANTLGFRSLAAEAVLAECFQKELSTREAGMSIRNFVARLECRKYNGCGEAGLADKISMRLGDHTTIPNIRFYAKQDREYVQKSAIWDFSGLDGTYTSLATYLSVYCLYCRRKRDFKDGRQDKKTYVFVDEFQNLDCDRESIIGTCLTEGQKYGLFLVLITQFLKGNFPDAVLNQLKQGGFRFHFRLSEEEAAVVSRQLTYNSRTQLELRRKLAEMPVGNCLVMGAHSVGKREVISEKFRFVSIHAGK